LSLKLEEEKLLQSR
jgi:hypothetical protein